MLQPRQRRRLFKRKIIVCVFGDLDNENTNCCVNFNCFKAHFSWLTICDSSDTMGKKLGKFLSMVKKLLDRKYSKKVNKCLLSLSQIELYSYYILVQLKNKWLGLVETNKLQILSYNK